MRDPESCRIKHTEDTEQQTGWCLFFSYQLGPIIERSTNTCKHIRDQNRTNADLMTLLLLRDPERSVQILHRFSVINRSNGADTVCDNNYRITWCCGRNSQMLLPHSLQGFYNLLREKFNHFSETTQLFTAL